MAGSCSDVAESALLYQHLMSISCKSNSLLSALHVPAVVVTLLQWLMSVFECSCCFSPCFLGMQGTVQPLPVTVPHLLATALLPQATAPPPQATAPPHQHTVPPRQHTVLPHQHTHPPLQHTAPPRQHTVPHLLHTAPHLLHTAPLVQHTHLHVQHTVQRVQAIVQPHLVTVLPVRLTAPLHQHILPPVRHTVPLVQVSQSAWISILLTWHLILSCASDLTLLSAHCQYVEPHEQQCVVQLC